LHRRRSFVGLGFVLLPVCQPPLVRSRSSFFSARFIRSHRFLPRILLSSAADLVLLLRVAPGDSVSRRGRLPDFRPVLSAYPALFFFWPRSTLPVLFHSLIFLRRSDSHAGAVPQFKDFSSLELSATGSRLSASQKLARARVPVILLVRIFFVLGL
jgi:hypothetical protein